MSKKTRRVLGTLLGSAAILATMAVGEAGASAAAAPHPTPHARAVCPDAAGHARCAAEVMLDVHGQPFHTSHPIVNSPIADTGGSVGYGPQEIHTAYALPWRSPVRQTIAVVDAYDHPRVKGDLDYYNSSFGLGAFPTCSSTVTTGCFQRVDERGNVSGFANSDPARANAWEVETALDVQAAHAICLNCKILLVEAYQDTPANLANAADTAARLGATEISNSYGWAESALSTWNPAAYNHPGIAITASTGDWGYGAYYPSDLNTVVAVGGTALRINADNSYNSETGWGNGVNAPGGRGTGGGCSAFASSYTTAPYWQKQVGNWTYTGCGTQRSVADVAAVADPSTGFWVYSSANGGWLIQGGTSLSAPLIAGVYALAGNAASATWPGQLPYLHPGQLHDVTTGTNGSCTAYIECHGWTGYDGPTGLGTPWGTGAF